jgi:type IV secretory pathway VirB3-like protein
MADSARLEESVTVSEQATWLNSFLFWDAVVVGGIIAFDWWMGNRNRKKLLRGLRHLFSDFRRRRVLPIYKRHATAALVLIELRLGVFGSRRFLLTSMLVALLPTLSILTLVSLQLRQDPTFLLQYPAYGWFGTFRTIFSNAAAIYVVFCLSVLLSTRLLKATRRLLPFTGKTRLVRAPVLGLVLLFALALGSAALLVAGAIVFLWLAESLSHHPQPELAQIALVTRKLLGLIPYYLAGLQVPHYRWTTGLLILLAISPLAIHLILSILFLIGKTASTVLNRFISVLLLRVSQGEQGVLRQLALFVGAAAKLIELAIKAF